jgi:hypothetical protein
MLIQFTVGNFKSFKEKATLSMEATIDDWREEDNVAVAQNQRLLKAAAIHGPNAGGKSNFLAAMTLFRELVAESSKQTQKGDRIPVKPFLLHAATEGAPSFFEAVFLQNGKRYRYGFEATPQAIVSEWLFSRADSIRETTLFTRETDTIEPTEAFNEGKGLERRTRSNALFLSVAAQFNGEISGEVMNWMNRFGTISGRDDTDLMPFTADLLNEPEYGPLIRELVKQVDFGIMNLRVQEIALEKIPEMFSKKVPPAVREAVMHSTTGGFAIRTSHQRFDAGNQPAGTVEFNLKSDESAGTQKFVALAGPFLHTLRRGSVLLVDELEAHLHPLLTRALVALFNSSANRKNAQLVYVTHDEELLNQKRIRRDQVWLVEKDFMGASRLFCLNEIKGVRKEAKFAKEYLLGQFGGVPHVGDLQGVLDRAHD